ncbi:MAG: hypothetical protein AAFZ99_09975, partial [Pseudomonadota bacterium]
TNRIPTHRDLMHRITLEIFTEIWLPHNGLLASKLGKKASTILGAIQRRLRPDTAKSCGKVWLWAVFGALRHHLYRPPMA